MAQAEGSALSAINRIWRAFSLQSHRSETFKLSADPYFVDKTRDIVGLCVEPPQHAMGSLRGREVAEVQQPPPGSQPRPCCRCVPARSTSAPMTTSSMARPRFSPRLTSPQARSSDSASGATAARSFASSWTAPRPTFRPTTSRSTSSCTTTRPTRRRRSDWFARRPRWHVHFTQRPHRGSTKSSAFSPIARKGISGAGFTGRPRNWRGRLPNTSRPSTRTVSRSAGITQPMNFPRLPNASASRPPKPHRPQDHNGTNFGVGTLDTRHPCPSRSLMGGRGDKPWVAEVFVPRIMWLIQ